MARLCHSKGRHSFPKLGALLFFLLAPLLVAARPAWSDSIDPNAPMQFIPVTFNASALTVTEGVLAVGQIVSNTQSLFENFVAQHPELTKRGDVVYLLSGGGDVNTGLALGKEIRQLGLQTAVAIPRWLADPYGLLGYVPDLPSHQVAAEIMGVYPSQCASSCTLLFLGGIARSVSDGSKFEVHRTFFEQGSSVFQDPNNTKSAFMDFGEEQMAMIANYVSGMGVSTEFVDYMAQGGHTEQDPILPLTSQQLLDLNVVTIERISATTNYQANQAPILSIIDQNGDLMLGKVGLSCDANHMLFVEAYFPSMPSPPLRVVLNLTASTGAVTAIAVPSYAFRLYSGPGGQATGDIVISPGQVFSAFSQARAFSVEVFGNSTSGFQVPLTDGVGSSMVPIPSSIQGQLFELARSC